MPEHPGDTSAMLFVQPMTFEHIIAKEHGGCPEPSNLRWIMDKPVASFFEFSFGNGAKVWFRLDLRCRLLEWHLKDLLPKLQTV